MPEAEVQLYSNVPLMRAAELRTLRGHPATIGAYNVNFYAQSEGVLKGLMRAEAPGILQASKGANQFQGGADKIAYMVREAMKNIKFNGAVSLHLDHGDEKAAMSCIENGFSSVMIDCSDVKKFTHIQNLEITKRITDEAHKRGISTEFEYGGLGGVEEDVEGKSSYADYRVVPAFFILTGADSGATTYGTSHGPFKGETDKVSLSVAAQCYQILYVFRINEDYYLVSHGSSTVPAEFVARINAKGGNLKGTSGMNEGVLRQVARFMRKVNIDTDLRLKMTADLREYFVAHPDAGKDSELVAYMQGIGDGSIKAIDVKTGTVIPAEEVTDPRNWLQEINKNAPDKLREDYHNSGDERFIEVMEMLSNSIADHVVHLSGDVFGGQGLVAEVDRSLTLEEMARRYAGK